MTPSFLPAVLRTAILRQRPLLLYAVTWSLLLTATVAVASLAPEIAFVWAAMPTSSFSRACAAAAAVPVLRVSTEGPAREAVCVPAWLFRRSAMDLLVPPLFAALVIGGASCFVRALGLWESDEDAAADAT